VVSTTAGGQFSYDANGNMTSRRITATAGVQTRADDDRPPTADGRRLWA
jgi:YD repeat-containing protein